MIRRDMLKQKTGMAELVAKHHKRGKQQCNSFMQSLGNEDTSLFYHPIKNNKVAFNNVRMVKHCQEIEEGAER